MRINVLIGFSIVFLVFSGWVAFVEVRPFLGGGTDQATRYQAQVNGSVQVGLSNFSQGLVLDDCLEAVTTIFGRLQPTHERMAVLGHCLTQTRKITRLAPTNSYAWFTQALISSFNGDAAELNSSLKNSRAMGQNEQWIAELRVELAEKERSELDAANLVGHDQDLRMLVGSSRGIRAIARRYLTQQDFKQRITDLVETLDEDLQRRFVERVRAEARQQGGL